MIDISKAGTFKLGDRIVRRMGYGAMQLAGKGVFGPPKDRAEAIAVLREAVASGVNHIDTSDYYGPYVTNEMIREALHPYPDDLVIVTKIGARRGEDASWLPAMAPAELESAVHDNLSRLRARRARGRQSQDHGEGPWAGRRVDRGAAHGPGRASGAGPGAPHRAQQRDADAGRGGTADLRHRLRAEYVQCRSSGGRRLHRRSRPRRDLPMCRSSLLAASRRCSRRRSSEVAKSLGVTPMQVALAWLLRRAPNILLIPGTSSIAHLRENLAAASLELPADAAAALDKIATQAWPPPDGRFRGRSPRRGGEYGASSSPCCWRRRRPAQG